MQLGPIQIGGQWKNVSSPVADGEAAAFVNYTAETWAIPLTFAAA